MKRMCVSVPEAAEAIGISERTLWQYMKDGSIAQVALGRRRLVRVEDVEAFVAARTHFGNPSDADTDDLADIDEAIEQLRGHR